MELMPPCSARYAYFGRSPRSLCDVGVDTRVSVVVGAGVGVGVAVGFHVGSAVFFASNVDIGMRADILV